MKSKFYLSILAIVKNEAPYIKEWLDYHISIGVEHFYIYDNESEDNLIETLSPSVTIDLSHIHFGQAKLNKYLHIIMH